MSSPLHKAALMVSSLVTDPREFYYRLGSIIDARTENANPKRTQYRSQTLESGLQQLESQLGCSILPFLNEPGLEHIEKQIAAANAALQANAPFSIHFNGDMTLVRFCYALVRAVKPRVMVETGVAYGRSSAYILAAMEANGVGILHSIDRPPLEKDAYAAIGALVPDGLRHRWVLHRGTTRRLLPPLLQHLRSIDIFLHDSLHTYRNMLWEYLVATPYLKRPGLLLSDDVGNNAAFADWAAAAQPALFSTLRHIGHEDTDKPDMIGFALLC